MPAVVLVLGVLTWWLIGRVLRPVDTMRAQMAEITASNLGGRIPEPGTGDEIDRLARTMNETLDRVEDAVRRQQRFVADASHELRSPLTTDPHRARGRPRPTRAERRSDRHRAQRPRRDDRSPAPRRRPPAPRAQRRRGDRVRWRLGRPRRHRAERDTTARRATVRSSSTASRVSAANVTGVPSQLTPRRSEPARQRRTSRLDDGDDHARRDRRPRPAHRDRRRSRDSR